MKVSCCVALALACVMGAVAACGGSAAVDLDASDAGGEGGAARDPFYSDGGLVDRSKPIGPVSPDGAPYVEPTCPGPLPPAVQNDCDTYKQTGCASGEGCFPYVIYPTGYCEAETYGATCAPAGTGTQGTACSGGNECAGGFVCVITGAGTQCAKMCKLSQAGSCPEGLVCDPLDVSGVGVCN